MNSKRNILLFGLFIFVAASCWGIWKLWRDSRAIPVVQPTGLETTPALEQKSNVVALEQNSPQNLTPRAPGLTDQSWSYISKLYQMSVSQNRPLEFHGRVLDQNDDPVSGVKITTHHSWFDTAWIQKAYPKSPAVNDAGGVPTLTEMNVLISGADGAFHLSKGQATSLHIRSLEKEGYQWDRKSGGETFVYASRFSKVSPSTLPSYMKTNGNHIIRVWKKGQAEHLIPISQILPISIPIIEDLRINMFSADQSSPDVIIQMPLLYPDDPNRQYDRRIQLKIIKGGLIEATNEFTYLSPETGFSETWETKLTPSDSKYDGGGWKKHFYVRLRNGRVTGSVLVNFDVPSGRFIFQGYLNPTGSRNLEPDPEKLITDPEEIRKLDEQTRGVQ